jgi:hypothetical protein
MTATPDDWEEMTEKEANENGVFDCPTCGRLGTSCVDLVTSISNDIAD